MTIADNEPAFLPVVIEPLSDDAPEWAQTLNANMGSLASGYNQVNANLSSIVSDIAKIRDIAEPTLASLQKSPVLRMLTGGK